MFKQAYLGSCQSAFGSVFTVLVFGATIALVMGGTTAMCVA